MMIFHNAVDKIAICKMVVEGHLILHPEKNQCSSSNADGKPRNVQKTIGLIFPKIADCCFEIILKHGEWFIQVMPFKPKKCRIDIYLIIYMLCYKISMALSGFGTMGVHL